MALDPLQKRYLQPLFGDLVDRVTITYNSQLLDRWSHDKRNSYWWRRLDLFF